MYLHFICIVFFFTIYLKNVFCVMILLKKIALMAIIIGFNGYVSHFLL